MKVLSLILLALAPLLVKDEIPKGYLPLHDLEAALKDLEEQQRKFSMLESRSKSLPRPANDYGPRRHLVGSPGPRKHLGGSPGPRRHLVGSPGRDEKELFEMHDLHDVDYDNYREKKRKELEERKRDDYVGFRDRGYDSEDEEYDQRRYVERRPWNDGEQRYRSYPEYYEREEDNPYPRKYRGDRARSAYDYGRRWEDPRGSDDDGGRWEDVEGRWEEGEVVTRRPRRLRRLWTVDESARHSVRYSPSPEREEWSDDEGRIPVRRSCPPPDWAYHGMEYPALDMPPKEELKPVPIWLCVLLVGGYIVAGTFLFRRWEGWSALDAAYFCFITLTTIGFGDFVPAQGVRGSPDAVSGASAAAAVHSLALCALYVLVGIALLAMAFNLVQEEVRANVASIATKLGIIKPKLHDYRDH